MGRRAILLGLLALAVSACGGSSNSTKIQATGRTDPTSTTQTPGQIDPMPTTVASGPLAPDPAAGEGELLYNLAYPAFDSMTWFSTKGYIDGDASVTPGPIARIGDRESFRVSDGTTIAASLVYANDDATFWLEDGLDVSERDLRRAADRFAREVLPRITEVFGPMPDPGIDGDRRLAVLHVEALGGAIGEFVSQDLLPASEFDGSNEREMIYLGLDGLTVGSDAYFATLAHELQHLLDFQTRQNTPLWMAEGMAQVAERIAGFDQVIADDDYLSNVAVPLNDWNAAQLDDRHYGGSYLFLTYIYERYGPQSMTDLMASKLTGMAAVDALARARGSDLNRLMGDWLAAIALDDASVGDGRFVFESDDLGRACPVIQPDVSPFKHILSVPQFAPRYYQVAGTGPIEISFAGATQIGAIPDLPYRGEYLWWAGRADSSASSMTRAFDLSGASSVTLEYRVWYDTGFDDGGTVQVSTDGGTSWDLLEGRRSGQVSLGSSFFIPAYTGTSGEGAEPNWVRDQVDLSDYAGESEVLVRFEFATDLFEGRIGMALDNIEIAELDYFDGAENGSDWQLAGFVRTDNRLPQPWAIRIIQPGASDPVTEVGVEGGRASITIDGGDGPATVAIVATAPGIGTRVEYELEVDGALDFPVELEGEREDFSVPCTGWEVEETDSYSLAVDDGGLTIILRQDDVFTWSSHPDFHEDVTISATATFENEQESLAGLMCRLTGDGFYDFEISSDGLFFAGVLTSEGFDVLQEWAPSPAIVTGAGAINQMELACLGTEFRFTVNGTTVLRVSDDQVRAGRVALSAGSFFDLTDDAIVVFEDVIINGADLGDQDNVILHETFDGESPKWTTFSSARSAVSIEEGAYFFEVRGSDWSADGYYEKSFADVIIDAEVRFNDLPPDGIVGIACRTDKLTQQYLFLVGADGFFSVMAYIDGDFVDIVPWSPLYSLDTQSGAVNQFHVECVGERLRFEVNGVVVADIADDRLTSGEVGFIGFTVERGGLTFDVLEVVLRRP